jgi:hypothetical protein
MISSGRLTVRDLISESYCMDKRTKTVTLRRGFYTPSAMQADVIGGALAGKSKSQLHRDTGHPVILPVATAESILHLERLASEYKRY